MQIDQVVIERADGPLFCGILFFEHEATPQYLPWSIDIKNPQKIVLKLFLPEKQERLGIVEEHYEALADAIVDRVMRQSH